MGGEAACSPPSGGYPDILYGGAWMCGWSGDLDHYSWLIFQPNSSGGSGTWLALDARCATCTGYLGCEGTGTFGLGQLLGSVILVNPPDCPERSDGLLITRICAPGAGDFPGTQAVMQVEHGASTVECYRFPFDHCDSELTVCGGPY
jgi:hypothetical protein